MKIVVTGGLGHIGSKLIRDLPASFPGAEIVVIDNMLTQRYASLFNLPGAGRYNFIEGDIMKYDMTSVLAGAECLIHLAAITDAASSFEHPEKVEEVNLKGTEIMAAACQKAGVPLVFISTTSVYGTQAEKVDENCSLDELKPQSPYADSKLKAEQFLQEMGRTAGLKFIICRFGTIFGISEGMRFHTAVNKFVWQAVFDKPITVWRTALDQNRPYLDLKDAVRAFSFIIEKKLYDRQVYNVLTLNASVRQITDAIQAEKGQIKIEYVDSKIMNQLSYHVLNDKFAGLGFKFTGDLKASLRESIRLLAQANSV